MGRLRDKVILITGAAGGIGSAIAEAVVRDGGIAVDTDLAGRAGIDHPLDVTSEADWQRVIGGGRRERRAGSMAWSTPPASPDSAPSRRPTTRCWRRIMAINLDGTFLGCKYALALMKRSGGSIVNISSVSGLVGGHNLAAYNASKGGGAAAVEIGRAAWRAAQPARCAAIRCTRPSSKGR